MTATEPKFDLTDLARRLTCKECRHSASQHDEGGCYEFDCACRLFVEIPDDRD